MGESSKHVAVLMGGWSSERPVSLASGAACAQAAREAGYQVTELDVDRDLAARLAELRPDVCLNALHGRWGEDGCVQGVLEVLGVPYTHSGVLASALAMDKARTKTMLAAAGIPVADSRICRRAEAAARHILPPPYVIKPVADGSSVGIHIVRDPALAEPPADIATGGAGPDERVMVERYVAGREFTVAVMADRALAVTEIVPEGGHEFYDFDAKYAPGGSRHILPAPISDTLTTRLKNFAVTAHQALGCRGISRTDFRFDDRPAGSGELVCLEVNTQPGMTATSLAPEQAAHVGISFVELVKWMIEDAGLER